MDFIHERIVLLFCWKLSRIFFLYKSFNLTFISKYQMVKTKNKNVKATKWRGSWFSDFHPIIRKHIWLTAFHFSLGKAFACEVWENWILNPFIHVSFFLMLFEILYFKKNLTLFLSWERICVRVGVSVHTDFGILIIIIYNKIQKIFLEVPLIVVKRVISKELSSFFKYFIHCTWSQDSCFVQFNVRFFVYV